VNTGTFRDKFFDHLVEVRVLSALVFDADDTLNKKMRRKKRGEERTGHVNFSIFIYFLSF